MINETFYELTEEKQREHLRKTILETRDCDDNPMSQAMLDIFVEDAYKANNLQKDLYFEILKLKPDEMSIETFDFCFLTRSPFFEAKTEEEVQLCLSVGQENNKICLLLDYYMIRASLLELVETFPQIASCVAESFFDLCQTFDHTRCNNCDLCTHKDVKTFEKFMLEKFNYDFFLIDFSTVRKHWSEIQEVIAFVVNSTPAIQLYFHRLVDRIVEKAEIVCTKQNCLCQLGAETLYKMSLTQRGINNELN